MPSRDRSAKTFDLPSSTLELQAKFFVPSYHNPKLKKKALTIPAPVRWAKAG